MLGHGPRSGTARAGRGSSTHRRRGRRAPRSRGGYRLLAEILASYLASAARTPPTRPSRPGRRGGRYLVDRRPPFATASADEDIEAVVQLLDEFGFDPRLEPDDGSGYTLLMQHCPFGEVADHYRKVVCSVHLGLIQGALAELGAHVEADGSSRSCARACAPPTSSPPALRKSLNRRAARGPRR